MFSEKQVSPPVLPRAALGGQSPHHNTDLAPIHSTAIFELVPCPDAIPMILIILVNFLRAAAASTSREKKYKTQDEESGARRISPASATTAKQLSFPSASDRGPGWGGAGRGGREDLPVSVSRPNKSNDDRSSWTLGPRGLAAPGGPSRHLAPSQGPHRPRRPAPPHPAPSCPAR